MHFIAYNIDGKIYSEFVVENKDICYTVTDQKGWHLLSLQRISDGILDAAGKLEEYPEGHPLVAVSYTHLTLPTNSLV